LDYLRTNPGSNALNAITRDPKLYMSILHGPAMPKEQYNLARRLKTLTNSSKRRQQRTRKNNRR
jgi:hypothetical protein